MTTTTTTKQNNFIECACNQLNLRQSFAVAINWHNSNRSGVARVGVTAVAATVRCNPYFFLKKTDDLLLVS